MEFPFDQHLRSQPTQTMPSQSSLELATIGQMTKATRHMLAIIRKRCFLGLTRQNRSHSAPFGGKRKSSASEGAAQVVVGIAVLAGKLRTAEPDSGFHLSRRQALRQQVPGDPEINNAPIGRRKTLGDAPSV